MFGWLVVWRRRAQ